MPSSWKTALDGLDCTTLQEIASLCSIPREHIEDVYRCTPFQMGIAADSNKRDATYVQRFVLSLKAGLDIDRLCHAVREVIALNAALRTRIVDCDLGIVQVVLKDETSTDTQQTNLSLEQYLGLDRSRPMGLGMPLVRSAITKGGEKWVLTMHHSISDHTSALALIADVAQICQGQCPRPRAPFKDFVVHVNSIEESKARNFWAAQFTSSPSIFPEVAKSHTVDANNHINRKIRIPRQQVVLSLLPAYVECAWALTAHVYQRGDSVAYGTVYSGRPPSLGGLETTSGPTIATVPVQVAVDGSDSVEDMVRKRQQARRKIQASGAFLQFGMANIRKASDAARKAAEFQTLLNIRHTAESSSNSAMIRFDGEDDVHRAFALCLTCTIGDDEIVVDAEFDDIVMSSATIGRVLTQLEHILRTLAKAGPKSRVGDIVLLSAHDRLQTLRWNAAVAEPMEECLHDMVGRTVLAQPDEVAIDAWDGKMVYHELHAQSRRLAHTLRQRGVQRESMVPCLFERSLWSVVATLGVLIAGGVCVPLDPTHPRARHEAILSRTKSAVVLTSPALTRTAAGLGPAVVVVSEEMMGEPPVATSDGGGDGGINQSRHQDLAPAATPGNAAYIIFTSGSTGVPKGVVLEHRALATALTSIGPRVGWQRGLRLLQFTAQVWDASIAEIFGALLFGGCLCIPSNTSRESGLADYIRASSVDWVFQTPTGIRNLAPGDVPSVKTLVSGGERIPQDAASTWGSKLRFINGWGPCETSIFAAFAELSPASPYPETIGTPVGCAIWITDPENVNRLVPVGAVGELVVEGATVARGYLQDHGKTAAAFVDPPTWAPRRSSAMTLARRFYRTGDLGKYNADGSICFLGRQDHQIKLRGQRFEPGEVETVLETCVGVRNIVVTTHRAPSGRTEVVAVLTLSHPQLPGRATLEKHPHNLQELVSTLIGSISAHVRARVPAYMVPTAWIPVQEIPRAASNKIDRTTICEWLQGKDVAGESMLSAEVLADSSTSSPASPAEEILRAVWSSVLAMPEDEIGRECSFLHLGGDSIMAMQVATRCRKRGLQISVATLMRTTAGNGQGAPVEPTHKHLVRQVVQRTPGLREADIESVALATDAQAWMLAVGEVADDGFSNEIYVDCADGLDAARLRRACELVVARHATLRTAFVPVGDSLYQVVLGNIDTATDPATTSRSPRRELWRRRFAGFHLDRLSRHGSQCHRLRLNIHHALYDALYLDMIVQDVAAAYCNGPLAAGLHFHDWLTHQTAAPDAAAARRFWQATLRRSAMTWLAPPQGPCRLHTQSARVRRTVGRRALLLPSAAEASVLKAAWATVLAHAVGGDDVVFGQVTANRDSPTDQVLGPCVNILPVRAAIGVAASFRALVQQLDQQQRASIPHQHLGFRSIIRDCTAWPSWTRFSSLLVYQNHDAMILDDGSTHFEMGGASCRLSGLGRPADASDVWVIAQPGAADVDLELRYTPTVVSAAQAEWLAEALVRVLEQRVVRMDSPNLESYQTAGDDAANSCVPGDMNHVPQTNSPCVKDEARQTVSDAWRQVGLLPQDKSDDEDVSMFNCGGDVVTALLLSDFFRSRGHAVGVADIIRHPTRPMQNALLSTCS
ncbi:hypothetical protein M409DRAFT_65791 [Zasmidium cellare ATCC 36951]|uniref:Carrier domain-containing protein n=1 Tax=Zasmidium cellare ATCC 36951 TaxID=1080233 RepID=A0A6A6CKT3_ZASCE|nr:uncharacterized protein M409DRAFT_65791 [Zasmidium cellare ATCC 36951]KAF2167651.1 hypothetical protein M409DRAFT_65791 [Zasmidium cellare ATCC 36951]